MAFYAQGGVREAQGRKGAVQGSQMDRLGGPIAGLVEANTFIRTLLRGHIRCTLGGPSHPHALHPKTADAFLEPEDQLKIHVMPLARAH